MTDFAGNLWQPPIFTQESGNPAFGDQVEPDRLLAWDVNAIAAGARAVTLPVDEIPQPRDGNRADTFAFLDWYNRIHVDPLRLDLGNVVSQQERELSLWNAFFVPHTLDNISAINNEGIVLTTPSAPPIAFKALEQIFVTFAISTEGPPAVDAHFTFEFDVEDFDVHVVGIRSVAWYWEINWVNPLLERLTWTTDVMTAYDGSEQRMSLVAGPRGEWEFTFDISDAQRRIFENIMFGWGARVWALPIWTDVEVMSQPIIAGASSIPLATAGRDFHALGLAIIIGPDGTYEAFGVDDVDADQVTAQSPIINTWPAGSRVYPTRPAYLLDPRSTARSHRNYARGIARFRSTDELIRESLDEPLYRDLPLMDREFNWREAPEIEYARKIDTYEYGSGKTVIIDESDLAIPLHRVVFTALDRVDADYLRAWLYARAGRWKGIWLPTWNDDLILTSSLSTSSTNVDVEACGLTHFAEGKPHRRDIRIQLKSGAVYYRRVTDPTAPNEITERLVMNATVPVQINPEDVERISWMHFVRLDQDSVEITWVNQNQAETTLALKGPRNDF